MAHNNPQPKPVHLHTLSGAAFILGVSLRTAHRMVSTGEITPDFVCPRRKLFLPETIKRAAMQRNKKL
ncbi:hypothetical protein [Puniceicoccus vermicola]|uniref:DNA-binding protein n=1 Tax=Puniceicoccus vermicola TaxID=388746 RepID=A0A7X1AXE9_9BACT|nr:hypothetical protein [Puniceicoccus vermicola]MBC2601766.1 hypothetical protein [Puniceicoccus vermicola]